MKHKKEKYIAKTKGGTDTKREEKKQGSTPMTSPRKKLSPTFEGGQMKTIKDAPEEFMREKKEAILKRAKAKMGMKEGGIVVKDKTVAIDTSPNSGLITTKGFGAGRRT